MRSALIVSVVMAGTVACTTQGNGAIGQDVAAPGGVTITAPVAGQLEVSWTADPLAFKYYVYQSTAGGGPFSIVGIVLDSTDPFGTPPPTTYTATGLAGGTQYCYELQSAYPDGSASDIGAAMCGTTTGTGTGTVGSVSTATTIIIPVASPIVGPPRSDLFVTLTGIGSSGTTLVVPLPFVPGSVMNQLRARIKDDGNGSRVQMVLARTTDGAEEFASLVTSQPSSGTGIEENIAINGGPDGSALSIASDTQYYAVLSNSSGTSTSTSDVYRLEADIN